MACCTCCDNPAYQNINRWALLALTIIVWVFSIVAVAHCSFWTIEGTDVGFGLFKYDEGGSCEKIPDNYDLSAAGQTGRAFGVLMTLCTSFSMLGIVAVIFFLQKGKAANRVWLATKILYGLSLLCTLLTFAYYGECVEFVGDNLSEFCELGTAGVLNTINVFILIGVIITAWLTPPPNEPIFHIYGANAQNAKPQGASASKVEEEQAPEAGTSIKKTVKKTAEGKKIIEEVTKPDGSKTITETMVVDA